MSEGSNRSQYTPPTLGEMLERAGMKYVPLAEIQTHDTKQKPNRNRNKESRRDHINRPTKEISMNETTMNGGPVTSNNTVNPGMVSPEGVSQIASTIERGMNQIHDSFREFGAVAVTLNGSMEEVMKATVETKNELHNRNKITLENVKGDLRTVGVAGIVVGVAYGLFQGALYLFSSDDAQKAPMPKKLP